MKSQYGLIGYPLGHSFSAKYFAEKFRREGIDASYENFEMPAVDDLRTFVEARPCLRGLNVTIPHKQAVVPLLDEVSPEAEAIGAVNVIKVAGNKLVGYNTDVIGFVDSLRPLLDGRSVGEALVLGTGGASRAVVYGLRRLGIAPQLVSRTPREGVICYDDIDSTWMRRAGLIVNCSPVGMFPHVNEAPALPYERLTPDHILYDLVYNPLVTKFLQLGRGRGALTCNGLEMLHRQAEAAWRIWNEA